MSDATIWSVTLHLSSTILEARFDDSNVFIGDATNQSMMGKCKTLMKQPLDQLVEPEKKI